MALKASPTNSAYPDFKGRWSLSGLGKRQTFLEGWREVFAGLGRGGAPGVAFKSPQLAARFKRDNRGAAAWIAPPSRCPAAQQ
jgi:hypothetical protein